MTRDEDSNGVEPSALRAIHHVLLRVNANLDLPTTLQSVADGVVAELGFAIAVVNLVEPDGDLQVAAVAGSEAARSALLGQRGTREEWDRLLARGESWGRLQFIPHTAMEGAVATGVPIWNPAGPEYVGEDAWHPKDELLAPMLGSRGQLVGVLSVDLPTDGRRPDRIRRQLLEMFAAQAAIAVDNARVHSRVAELLRRLTAVVEAAPVAIYETDLDGRIRLWNAAAEQVFGWPREDVLGQPLSELFETVGELPDQVIPVRRDETVRHRRDGRAVYLEVASAIVPGPSGEPVGYLGVSLDIGHRKRLEETLRHQASTDRLTGLPNRQLFDERLQQAVARAQQTGEPVGLLLIDLDGFKSVNDRHGHSFGDEVLVQLARRLAGCVRDTDTVARLGGDEFVVLVEGPELVERAEEIAHRLLSATRAPVATRVGRLQLGSSVGIAVLSDWTRYPSTTQAAADLIRRADTAMYEAKALGKDTHRWYVDPPTHLPEIARTA